jgi:Ser/Thr protein kinase RdoA (MazF antagonist)
MMADAVVLKFYRPGRWSDAQIAEVHTFTAELAAAEMAVAAPGVPGRIAAPDRRVPFHGLQCWRGSAPG